MCGFAEAALATSIISSAAGIGQSVAQHSARKRAARAEADRIRRQTIQTYDALGRRGADERIKALDTLQESADKALRAQERARTRRGEAGVSGLSVAALSRDIAGSAARFGDSVRAAQERGRADIQAQAERAALGAEAGMAGISQPWAPIGVLSDLSRGLSAAADLKEKLDPTPPPPADGSRATA